MITNILCFNDIVTWSTANKIRVIHYSRRQKICLIERPKRYPTFPEYIYNSTAAKPSFRWVKEYGTNADVLEIVWLNLIKLCRLRQTDDKKYKMEVMKK